MTTSDEVGPERLAEIVDRIGSGHRLGLRRGVALLPRPASAIATKVIERHPPGNLDQPDRGTPLGGVETPPVAQRTLEGRRGQVVGKVTVADQVAEVSVHPVEVLLGHVGKARP